MTASIRVVQRVVRDVGDAIDAQPCGCFTDLVNVVIVMRTTRISRLSRMVRPCDDCDGIAPNFEFINTGAFAPELFRVNRINMVAVARRRYDLTSCSLPF